MSVHGLPSSTEIKKLVHKKLLYAKFPKELCGERRKQFDDDIGRIVVTNEISPVEIKCDMKLQETGNVYIEYQERITKDGEWVDSGILKKDETRYFLIGTVEKFYILPRTKLQSYYNRLVKYGEKLSGMRLVEEKEHQTSKGFIMSKRRAEQDSLTVEEVVNILKNE